MTGDGGKTVSKQLNLNKADKIGLDISRVKDATKFRNGRQRSTQKIFVGAKTTKLKERNYSNFTITFPTIWRCASDFFKVLLKLKMAAMDKLHIFWAQKLKN